MWFAALGDWRDYWFIRLLEQIGTGDPVIRTIMGPDPFDGRAPDQLRVRICTYRYATRAERRAARRAGQTPPWWIRDEPRMLMGPLSFLR